MERASWVHGANLGSGIALLGHSQAASSSHFASLNDFYPWQKAMPADMEELLLHPQHAQRIAPYCICAKSKCVVLVELPSPEDYIEPRALFFQTQRQRAQRVYCVPFHRAVRLAQNLAPRVDSRRLLVVFNTGRCGSNLLSAALAEFQGVCSISEPDFFAPLYVPVPAQAHVEPQEMAVQLVWAATVLLQHWAQHCMPAFRLLVVKARSRLVADPSGALRALPGARTAMMYRRFLPTVSSMALAFRPYISRHWLLGLACTLGLDPLLYCVLWLLRGARWRELRAMPVVAGARPPVPPHVVWRCGHLAVHAVKVLNALEYARYAHAEGLLTFCITYELLVRHRGAYLRQILAACEPEHFAGRGQDGMADGGPEEAQVKFSLRPGASLDRVFSKDQHMGRLVSSSGGPDMWRMLSQGGVMDHGLSRVQAARVEALRRWLQPWQRNADELLPGTIVPDADHSSKF